jgi:hypothetical protein
MLKVLKGLNKISFKTEGQSNENCGRAERYQGKNNLNFKTQTTKGVTIVTYEACRPVTIYTTGLQTVGRARSGGGRCWSSGGRGSEFFL